MKRLDLGMVRLTLAANHYDAFMSGGTFGTEPDKTTWAIHLVVRRRHSPQVDLYATPALEQATSSLYRRIGAVNAPASNVGSR